MKATLKFIPFSERLPRFVKETDCTGMKAWITEPVILMGTDKDGKTVFGMENLYVWEDGAVEASETLPFDSNDGRMDLQDYAQPWKLWTHWARLPNVQLKGE